MADQTEDATAAALPAAEQQQGGGGSHSFSSTLSASRNGGFFTPPAALTPGRRSSGDRSQSFASFTVGSTTRRASLVPEGGHATLASHTNGNDSRRSSSDEANQLAPSARSGFSESSPESTAAGGQPRRSRTARRLSTSWSDPPSRRFSLDDTEEGTPQSSPWIRKRSLTPDFDYIRPPYSFLGAAGPDGMDLPSIPLPMVYSQHQPGAASPMSGSSRVYELRSGDVGSSGSPRSVRSRSAGSPLSPHGHHSRRRHPRLRLSLSGSQFDLSLRGPPAGHQHNAPQQFHLVSPPAAPSGPGVQSSTLGTAVVEVNSMSETPSGSPTGLDLRQQQQQQQQQHQGIGTTAAERLPGSLFAPGHVGIAAKTGSIRQEEQEDAGTFRRLHAQTLPVRRHTLPANSSTTEEHFNEQIGSSVVVVSSEPSSETNSPVGASAGVQRSTLLLPPAIATHQHTPAERSTHGSNSSGGAPGAVSAAERFGSLSQTASARSLQAHHEHSVSAAFRMTQSGLASPSHARPSIVRSTSTLSPLCAVTPFEELSLEAHFGSAVTEGLDTSPGPSMAVPHPGLVGVGSEEDGDQHPDSETVSPPVVNMTPPVTAL